MNISKCTWFYLEYAYFSLIQFQLGYIYVFLQTRTVLLTYQMALFWYLAIREIHMHDYLCQNNQKKEFNIFSNGPY